MLSPPEEGSLLESEVETLLATLSFLRLVLNHVR